jgi:hypothetical protein
MPAPAGGRRGRRFVNASTIEEPHWRLPHWNRPSARANRARAFRCRTEQPSRRDRDRLPETFPGVETGYSLMVPTRDHRMMRGSDGKTKPDDTELRFEQQPAASRRTTADRYRLPLAETTTPVLAQYLREMIVRCEALAREGEAV